MKLRRELKLLIGLRWCGISTGNGNRQIEALLNEITRLEASIRIPLHWIFSLTALLNPGTLRISEARSLDELTVEIKARLKRRGDTVIPTGFRGAIHPLLAADELERELDWCRANPWQPGFEELFGRKPEMIMPVYPDLLREQVQGIYSNRGFRALGVPGHYPARPASASSLTVRPFLRPWANRQSALFTYLTLPPQQVRHWLKNPPRLKIPRDGRLFILLDLPGEEKSAGHGEAPVKEGLLKAFLELLNNRYRLTLCSLSDPGILAPNSDESADPSKPLSAAAKRPASGPADPDPVDPGLVNPDLVDPGLIPELSGVDPALRRDWLKAEPVRRRRRKREDDYRSILHFLVPPRGIATPVSPGEPESASKSAWANPAGDALSKDRLPTASMSGVVELLGQALRAHFLGGRLTGLSAQGKQLLSGLPARSYLNIAGKKHHFRTESAFSFESTGTKEELGLRSLLKINLPGSDEPQEGLLMVDSYFLDSHSDLILNFRLHYPPLKGEWELREVVPYEIPLFLFSEDEPVRVQSFYPRGLCSTHMIAGEIPLQVLWGSRFIFTMNQQAIAVHCNPQDGPTIGPLHLRCRSKGRRCLLSINLGGSYQAVDPRRYGGQVDSFSFKIGLAS